MSSVKMVIYGFYTNSNQTKYFLKLLKNSLNPTECQHVYRTRMYQSGESWLYNLSISTLLYNTRIIFGKKPNVCDIYNPLILFVASNALMLHLQENQDTTVATNWNWCLNHFQLLRERLHQGSFLRNSFNWKC